MNNGKLGTLKNWLKALVLSPCSIAGVMALLPPLKPQAELFIQLKLCHKIMGSG